MTNKSIVYKPISPEIEELTSEHHHDREAALELLKDIQTRHAGLSPATVTDAARALKLPPHHLYGLATFYSMLSLQERRNILRVCDGPVCWIKRASKQTRRIFLRSCNESME